VRRLAVALVLLAACRSAPPPIPAVAESRIAPDFETYTLERVGLMPFAGDHLELDRGLDLQRGFYAELARVAPFEVVLLDARDLEEVQESEPYRRGWYRPQTIVDVSRRYRLDGILFGTVVDEQLFPPQLLGLQVDLVAAETGLVIWSSEAQLDARDDRVRLGLELYYGGDDDGEPWEISLLSPSRFARFAAYQIARTY